MSVCCCVVLCCVALSLWLPAAVAAAGGVATGSRAACRSAEQMCSTHHRCLPCMTSCSALPRPPACASPACPHFTVMRWQFLHPLLPRPTIPMQRDHGRGGPDAAPPAAAAEAAPGGAATQAAARASGRLDVQAIKTTPLCAHVGAEIEPHYARPAAAASLQLELAPRRPPVDGCLQPTHGSSGSSGAAAARLAPAAAATTQRHCYVQNPT